MARQHRPGGFDLHPDTISIKYGEEATPNAPEPGDVVSPIHLATTFAVDEVIDDRDWTEYEPEASTSTGTRTPPAARLQPPTTSSRRTSGCSRRLTTGPGWPRSTAISFSAG